MRKPAYRLCASLFLSILLSSFTLAQQEEKLTITTYYPSPTGVYQTLKVVDKAEFNTQRQGGHNHVIIHGAGPAAHYGVLSFSAFNGVNDVNTAGVWGFIESNTTGSESGGLMFATKRETDTLPVNRVTINRAGNVGLGVYPAAKLHINATSGHMLLLQQDNSTALNQTAGLRWRSGTREGYVFVNNENSPSWYGGSGSMNLYTSNGNITFYTSATEKMRLGTNGRLGIGTTNPLTGVHVSSSDDNNARFTSTHTGMTGSPSMYMGMNAGNNAGLIELTAGKDFKLWNGQLAMTVNGTNGNVGINTMTPSCRLTVLSNSPLFNSHTTSDFVEFSRDGNDSLVFGVLSENSQYKGYEMRALDMNAPNNPNLLLSFALGNFGSMGILIKGEDPATGNRVGIGKEPGAGFKLDVNGAVRCTSWSASDLRLKKDIQPLQDAAEMIAHLQGVSFVWNSEKYPKQHFVKGRQFGLVAQEVEKVLPEIVLTDEEGYKSINYDQMIPVLVEAVKELSDENKRIRGQVERLRKAVESYGMRVE